MTPEQSWILDALTALGQADHISGSVPHPTDPDGRIGYHQPGVMKITTLTRAELIARGWRLLRP